MYNINRIFVFMQKPYNAWHFILFILGCFIILGTLILIVPTGEVNILGYKFHFLSAQKLREGKIQNTVNIKKIITNIDTSTVYFEDSAISKDSILQNFTIRKDNTLDYNRKGKEKLFHFFLQLKHAKDKKIRILHFGDSQIEGDRITRFIRERMQEKFGGIGPGFIPAINIYNTISFETTHSKNFVRYTNFRGKKLVNNNNYGLLNTVGRFSPEMSATTKTTTRLLDTAWIKISPGTTSYKKLKKYTEIALYYTDVETNCALNIYKDGQLIRHDSLSQEAGLHVDSLTFKSTPSVLKFEFITKTSPNILGFSLDGKTGVQVDNIAMRGSSGLFLEKTNQTLFKNMVDATNVQLFIMQFGGNAVPYIKDSLQARNVIARFKQQLQFLQKIQPKAAIIVIGPSDMSYISEGSFVTYPLLPYYKNQLKKACLNAGAVYFDVFHTMGGKNAMVEWVKHGLARQDHTHFTFRGAKIIAQQFYNALMKSYLDLTLQP